jgi:hypothetical protein
LDSSDSTFSLLDSSSTNKVEISTTQAEQNNASKPIEIHSDESKEKEIQKKEKIENEVKEEQKESLKLPPIVQKVKSDQEQIKLSPLE